MPSKFVNRRVWRQDAAGLKLSHCKKSSQTISAKLKVAMAQTDTSKIPAKKAPPASSDASPQATPVKKKSVVEVTLSYKIVAAIGHLAQLPMQAFDVFGFCVNI